MAETLGQRIRRLRVRYGMTQAELARRIHVTANGMNRIECGETPDPRASRIAAIADVLGVSADIILGRTPEKSECERAAVASVGA
jgi:transcriptional regulator with XRE-family HTH domain